MIEDTLISNIFEKICEMTTKPWECQINDGQLLPFKHLINIKTWGKEWKRTIDKTNEWAAWRWANVKINKQSLAILKQIVNIPKEDMEDYY